MGYRQVGKARDSESRMRWFESSYPSHADYAADAAFFFMNFQEEKPTAQTKLGSLSNVVVTLDRMYPIECISMPPYRPVVASFVVLSVPYHSKGTESCA